MYFNYLIVDLETTPDPNYLGFVEFPDPSIMGLAPLPDPRSSALVNPSD